MILRLGNKCSEVFVDQAGEFIVHACGRYSDSRRQGRAGGVELVESRAQEKESSVACLEVCTRLQRRRGDLIA